MYGRKIMADPVNPNQSHSLIQANATSHSNVSKKEGFWLGRKIDYIRDYLKSYYEFYAPVSDGAFNRGNPIWKTENAFNRDNADWVKVRRFQGIINAASLFTLNIKYLKDWYNDPKNCKHSFTDIFKGHMKNKDVKFLSKVNYVLSHVPIIAVISNLFFSVFPHLISKPDDNADFERLKKQI